MPGSSLNPHAAMHAWAFLGVIAVALGSAWAVAGGDVADAEIRLAAAAAAPSLTLGPLKTAKEFHEPPLP
jgi:hypothetical protein